MTERDRGLSAVAALIGGNPYDWQERVRGFARRFRALPASTLRSSHFGTSTASPIEAAELAAAVVPADLGEVDAFISHSWSDDGGAKFEALSAWIVDFEVEHGRTPLLWLDKACIDQNDIEASLCGIPIFVRSSSTETCISAAREMLRMPVVTVLRTTLQVSPKNILGMTAC